jgi:hypothetical protein
MGKYRKENNIQARGCLPLLGMKGTLKLPHELPMIQLQEESVAEGML